MAKKKKSSGGGGGNSKKEEEPQREWTDEMEKDYERILSVGEECISSKELKSLILAKGRGSKLQIEDNKTFNLYDGFEPSGRMHIAQGVFKAMNVNKCTFDGTNSTFVFWVADWFALMNDKMGGDLNKIKIVGKYLIEVWKAAGMNLDNVEFKWASDEITNNAHIYWPLMLDVARRFTVSRIKKCCQIMGRLEGTLTSAQVLYPLMQCTDVFFLKADICQLGVDQRKVNMLAREYCDYAKRKNKPIILSHHMLYGLKAGQEKMSKSDPDSAIFMEDSKEDVERKILAAYCPNKEEEITKNIEESAADAGKESMHLVEDTLKNPCLDYIQNIIFSPPNASFTVPGAGDGDGTTYEDFNTVKDAFLNGTITEEQLKRGLIDELNKLLEPVRDHFTNDDNAKTLLEQVRQFKKESNTTVGKDTTTIRRCNLRAVGIIPSSNDCHLVFAPLPTAVPTLQQVVNVLEQIRSCCNNNNETVILYISDWTARVESCCDADIKVIDSYNKILISALTCIDPLLMKERVQIIKQSDAILADPSNYWISVINVGRHFMLDDVMGSTMNDSNSVGIVIGRLMRIADIISVNPKSISFCTSDDDNKADDNIDNSNNGDTIISNLIQRYYDEKLCSDTDINKYEIINCRGVSVQLQQPRESDAHKTDNDEYFLLDNPKEHGKSKMKKAFCEPGNVTFCPPISLVSYFCFNNDKKEFIVERSDENGGNVTYASKSDIEKDFESGTLHPGDLKTAASTIMIDILTKLSDTIKDDKDITQASKSIKAYQKKISKQKTKK